MSRAIPLILLIQAVILCPVVSVMGSDLRVTDLTCEYQSDPLGIDVAAPRLSWKLQADQRGQRQSAYQILVATDEAKLTDGRADLWDTGKVAPDRSLQIVYAGRPLQSRQVCYWKVRVWDKDGEPTSFSAVARWEMGLLAEKDWQAEWINDGKANPQDDAAFYEDDPAPLFRKTFDLPEDAVKARLYITGLGYYDAHLNGRPVGDRRLDPAWTVYAKRVFYSTYDVTSLLQEGSNVLAVTLGNGWYNPLPLRMWGHLNLREHLTIGRPRLLAQLEIERADGSRTCIVSDESWKVAEGPLLRNSIYLGERYDARKEIEGWDGPEIRRLGLGACRPRERTDWAVAVPAIASDPRDCDAQAGEGHRAEQGRGHLRYGAELRRLGESWRWTCRAGPRSPCVMVNCCTRTAR